MIVFCHVYSVNKIDNKVKWRSFLAPIERQLVSGAYSESQGSFKEIVAPYWPSVQAAVVRRLLGSAGCGKEGDAGTYCVAYYADTCLRKRAGTM